MYRAIEIFMLQEFITDALLLYSVFRGRIHIRIGRLFIASSVGAIFSGFSVLHGLCGITLFVSGILCSVVMVFCISRSFRPIYILSLISGTSAMVGIARIIPIESCLLKLTAGISASFILMKICRQWTDSWDCSVHISHMGKSVELHGIVDTGNRLKEPLSALPVMIVSSKHLSPILPEGFIPEKALSTMPLNFRPAAYGALGGGGIIGCFIPERITVHFAGRTADIQDVWIGVFPGNIPGAHEVLVPAQAISNISMNQKRRSKYVRIQIGN